MVFRLFGLFLQVQPDSLHPLVAYSQSHFADFQSHVSLYAPHALCYLLYALSDFFPVKKALLTLIFKFISQIPLHAAHAHPVYYHFLAYAVHHSSSQWSSPHRLFLLDEPQFQDYFAFLYALLLLFL